MFAPLVAKKAASATPPTHRAGRGGAKQAQPLRPVPQAGRAPGPAPRPFSDNPALSLNQPRSLTGSLSKDEEHLDGEDLENEMTLVQDWLKVNPSTTESDHLRSELDALQLEASQREKAGPTAYQRLKMFNEERDKIWNSDRDHFEKMKIWASYSQSFTPEELAKIERKHPFYRQQRELYEEKYDPDRPGQPRDLHFEQGTPDDPVIFGYAGEDYPTMAKASEFKAAQDRAVVRDVQNKIEGIAGGGPLSLAGRVLGATTAWLAGKDVQAGGEIGAGLGNFFDPLMQAIGGKASYSPDVKNKPWDRYSGKPGIVESPPAANVGRAPPREPVPTPVAGIGKDARQAFKTLPEAVPYSGAAKDPNRQIWSGGPVGGAPPVAKQAPVRPPKPPGTTSGGGGAPAPADPLHAALRMDVQPEQTIVDAETLIALDKATQPGAKLTEGEKSILQYMQGRPVIATETSLGQFRDAGARGSVPVARSEPHTSAQRKAIVDDLAAKGVGTKGGAADREVVADAFLARTAPPKAGELGTAPVFATSDPGIINGLFRLSGMNPAKIGGYNVAEFIRYTRGVGTFAVQVQGRVLMVRPLQPIGPRR